MSEITTKGFDPKNLTFNGVKIEEGDEIGLYGSDKRRLVKKTHGTLALVFLQNLICLKFFNITAHYPKKQVLKRPNGSLLERVANSCSYYFINTAGAISLTDEDYCDVDKYRYTTGNYFATEEEAQAWLDKLLVYYDLKLKIDKINAENGWIAWKDNEYEYYLTKKPIWNENSGKDGYNQGKGYDSTNQMDRYIMSQQAIDYMMSDEVSDEDFKTFVEVSSSF